MHSEDRERELSLKQRAADDRAFATQPLDGGEISFRADPSGRKHRQLRPSTHAREQIEIGPSEGSVAVNRGAEETAYAHR